MRPIKGKSKIYNICLKHISTVNSFVYDDGINHFEPMVETLEKYLHSERLKWTRKMRKIIDLMWIKKEKDKTGHDAGWNSALAELEARLKRLEQLEKK